MYKRLYLYNGFIRRAFISFRILFLNKGKIINLNLGPGKGTTVIELINSFQAVKKIKIAYLETEKREGDFENIIASNELSRIILKWMPKEMFLIFPLMDGNERGLILMDINRKF